MLLCYYCISKTFLTCTFLGVVYYFIFQLTSSVHDCQHDGGDPGHLAAGAVEDDLDLLEEDSDGLGKGKGEPDGDEGSHHHRPAPATLWRSIAHRTAHRWGHAVRAVVLTPPTLKGWSHTPV